VAIPPFLIIQGHDTTIVKGNCRVLGTLLLGQPCPTQAVYLIGKGQSLEAQLPIVKLGSK